MLKKITIFLALTLTLFGVITPKETGRAYITNYSYRDYNGDNQIWGVAQDRVGNLFFVNSNVGVLKYNGQEFKTIKLSNNSSGRSITSQNGVIYVGGVSDFGYIKDINRESSFVSLLPLIDKKYKKFGYVWESVSDGKNIYFGTDNYIFKYDGKKVTVIEHKKGFHITRAVNNRVFTRIFDVGLVELKDGKLIDIPKGDFFKDKSVNAVLKYDIDNYLILSRDSGAFLYDGVNIKEFKIEDIEFLKEAQIYDAINLDKGLIAIGTKKGILIIDKAGESRYFLDKSKGLIDDFITHLFVDRENNLWLSLNNGIAKVEIPSELSLYGKFSGIEDSINSIIDYDTLFLSTMRGIYKKQDNPKKESKTFARLEGVDTNCWEFEKFKERLLVGCNSGIYEITKERVIDLKITKDIVFDMVSTKDKLFIGLKDKIALLNSSLETTKEYKLGTHPWNLVIMKNYLFGTSEDGKIFKIDLSNDKIEFLKITLTNPKFADIDEKIYLSSDEGVYRYIDGEFVKDRDFKEFKIVKKLIGDESGNFWVRYDKVAKTYYKNNKNIQSFPFRRFQGYKIDAIFTENNITWFGGPEGLIKYRPLNIYKNRAFSSHIESIEINDKVIVGNKNVENREYIFEYKNNNIKFTFSAPYFVEEKSITYSTFLEGFDAKYSHYSKETMVNYTNLPEGKYTFFVKAKNIFDSDSAIDRFSFEILPPWYRTWYAYLAYILLSFIFIFLLIFFQLKKEREKAQLKLEKEKEQKKVLEIKVKEKTKELKENNDELLKSNDTIKNLLDNANDGFLSFSKNFIIDSEYSKECERIFEQKIAQEDFCEIINFEKEAFLRNAIKSIFNEPMEIKRDFLAKLLPKELFIKNKYVKCEYNLISKNKMMVILTDISKTKKLERQMQEEKANLKMVVSSVVNRNETLELLKDFNEFFEKDLPKLIEAKDKKEIYRQIHTFKSSFAQMDMVKSSENLHQIETNISNTLNLKDVFKEPHKNITKDDLETLGTILGDEFFKQKKTIQIETKRIENIEENLKYAKTIKDIKKISSEIKKLRYIPFKDYLKSYPKLIDNLSVKLGKSIKEMKIEGGEFLVEPEIYSNFTKTLIHIFRNSIDHGIENMEDRMELEKHETATIRTKISQKDKSIVLEIFDDGAGIDTKKIKSKALSQHIYTKEELDSFSKSRVLNIIFEDNFSTKDSVSIYSGRGVGLASVKSELDKLGGKVDIKTIIGKGTIFKFYLPIK